MGKFVPRQHKRKVLDRTKVKKDPDFDSNAIEIIAPAKASILEEKQRIKAELESQGNNISGKKAKRLEKFLEAKLKKDENRILLEKVAKSTTDTSLLQSSRRLGQGKETKRERLQRGLRETQAGIDIDGDNEEILFERRTVREREDESAEEERESKGGLFRGPVQTAQPTFIPGTGLKRPLEVDDEGRPVLRKRQKRGGIESKISLVRQPIEEPEWEGFSSECEVDSDADSAEDSQHEDTSSGSESSSAENDEIESGSSDEEDGEDSDNSSSESEEDEGIKKERSSAFKAWANTQLNEALGYQPSSNIQLATETVKIEGFKPRAPEQDLLPLELQPTTNIERKSQFVTVTRTEEIQTARLQLPVVAEEQKIMEAIHNNDTVVIYGATGSGKTTQVPQFLFEAGYGSSGDNPGMIGITQPRRVAAVSMATRVGNEMGDHGHKVAYQIRFERSVKSDTAVKFMTDGVLLREVGIDLMLKKYSAIIIDEAHERSVNTDILISLLSKVVKLRKEESEKDSAIKPLKLVIMSATLRVTDFTENKTLFRTPPPVIQAEGRQYPVTVHFSRRTQHDYVEEVFRKISRGHRKLPPGGFLVFLTGQNEITQLGKRLGESFGRGFTAAGPQVRVSGKDLPVEAEDVDFGDMVDDNDENDDYDEDDVDIQVEDADEFDVGEDEESGPAKMHVLPLYSLLPNKEQLRVFDPPPSGTRLVILATNVAETSLTIPGISYVFDCGRSKERKFDQARGVQSFEVGWISKASASQRAGRAGRTGPGHCYRLYSSAVYERDFEEFAVPEILRMPIEGVVLQLKSMNLTHVTNFPFPTPPERGSLASSERLLKYLSAITPIGNITELGATMSIFPLSPRFAKILLVGHQKGCLPYTIALVAALSAPDVFIPENLAVPPAPPAPEPGTYLTTEQHLAADQRTSARRAFGAANHAFCALDDHADAIKLLQVVGEFAHEPTDAWCTAHFVRFKVLKEIQQLRMQLTGLLKTHIAAFAGLKWEDGGKLEKPSAGQVKLLKQMAAAGFVDHVAMRADMAPSPPEMPRKPKRAIDVPYLTLFPSHAHHVDEADMAVYIHPSSPLAHLTPQECPQYIIYSYLQQPAPAVDAVKVPKTRMHALTDISATQLAGLAKGTPLLEYGKPIREVRNDGKEREVVVVPTLRAEGKGGLGWPLPARTVVQRKIGKAGWVVV